MKENLKETMINVLSGLYALDKLQNIEELINTTDSDLVSKNKIKEILSQNDSLFKEDDLYEK